MCAVVSKYSKNFLTFSAQNAVTLRLFFVCQTLFKANMRLLGRLSFFECANLCFGVFRRDTPLTQFVRQPQNMACNGKRFN